MGSEVLKPANIKMLDVTPCNLIDGCESYSTKLFVKINCACCGPGIVESVTRERVDSFRISCLIAFSFQ
jgi:hypothetical protein